MKHAEAEEFTQSLSQIFAGSYRQILWAQQQRIPEALGLTTNEWVTERLGGYVRMSIPDRREAVAELTEEGLSNREQAQVLGVDEGTIRNDKRPAEDSAPEAAATVDDPVVDGPPAEDSAPEAGDAEEPAGLAPLIEAGEADLDLQRKRGERLLANFQLAVANLNAARAVVADAAIHGDRDKHEKTIERCVDMLAELRREMAEHSQLRRVK